jgi:hypothetical protein
VWVRDTHLNLSIKHSVVFKSITSSFREIQEWGSLEVEAAASTTSL